MYATHRLDLFYITVKYHDYIPKGFQVLERTQICIKSIKGEITQKVLKRELSFLYTIRRYDLFYIMGEVTISSTEPYSLIKISLTVFKIEGGGGGGAGCLCRI